jgi:hypothetical protein
MAAITKNRNFFKLPKLLYFKPELYKHNDELFNIYYGIFLWTLNFCLFTQESFQQSLVEIGSVVLEEKIFLNFIPPFF